MATTTAKNLKRNHRRLWEEEARGRIFYCKRRNMDGVGEWELLVIGDHYDGTVAFTVGGRYSRTGRVIIGSRCDSVTTAIKDPCNGNETATTGQWVVVSGF
ncbi:hypothetical protein HAX54_033908 [Datura stramonium]|uniref:Uncharacterized protein n=1 Tax=Datura stramonium TaxID=4076 RepID=A0ABS8VEH1_DATST|nr:hypothetical protein [Datura stramonium]